MAQLIITIPDAVATRVMDAVAAHYLWSPIGGQTKAQFVKSVVIDFLKGIVKAYEADKIKNTADVTVGVDVDTNIQLT